MDEKLALHIANSVAAEMRRGFGYEVVRAAVEILWAEQSTKAA